MQNDHHHEFRYVLSTDLLGAGFSSHWAPYWRSCTPCHFSYDIIMKVMVVLVVFITIGFTVGIITSKITNIITIILSHRHHHHQGTIITKVNIIQIIIIKINCTLVQLETGADDLAYLWQRTGLDSQVRPINLVLDKKFLVPSDPS